MAKLKNRLKYWRHQHMMDQTEFSAFLGFRRQQYNRWELQAMQPNLETAWDIAKKLSIKIEDLFEEQE